MEGDFKISAYKEREHPQWAGTCTAASSLDGAPRNCCGLTERIKRKSDSLDLDNPDRDPRIISYVLHGFNNLAAISYLVQ